MQAVVLTEVTLRGGGGEAVENGVRVEIGDLKLFFELFDLLFDEPFGNLLFRSSILLADAFTVRPENSPTTRTRHSASESTRFFIVSSSFVVMHVYNRNTCLS